jgi:hypothetical protein
MAPRVGSLAAPVSPPPSVSVRGRGRDPERGAERSERRGQESDAVQVESKGTKRTRYQEELGRTYRGRGRGSGRSEETPPPTTPNPPATTSPPGTPTTQGTQGSTPTPTTGATPSTTPTPATSTGGKDIKSLAQRYVANYERDSGNTLSAEQRSALTAEVADFYDEPERAGRLERLVTAL